MNALKLPGLYDLHVHMREPGATHKEDWESGTAAALAGGFTTVLAMPNTQPSITDESTFVTTTQIAAQSARCDWGQFVGAGPANAQELNSFAHKSAGLKMYLDATYGNLRLDDMTLWTAHFENWNAQLPIAIHAEGRTMAAAILMADLYKRPIHICHVSTKEEILLIRKAKERGIPVTCEVAPHHLLLTHNDTPALGIGRSEVRPRLATPEDQKSLWENLDVIDCFATDHAPHTVSEKDSDKPPPGFPGLETALPLLLSAVHAGRLTMEDIILRMHTNPGHIFNIPLQPDTYVEIDPDAVWQINAKEMQSKCGWTPFENWETHGRVQRVVLRGDLVYEKGKVLAQPGYGINIRS